jgi:hypothetical protein
MKKKEVKLETAAIKYVVDKKDEKKIETRKVNVVIKKD